MPLRTLRERLRYRRRASAKDHDPPPPGDAHHQHLHHLNPGDASQDEPDPATISFEELAEGKDGDDSINNSRQPPPPPAPSQPAAAPLPSGRALRRPRRARLLLPGSESMTTAAATAPAVIAPVHLPNRASTPATTTTPDAHYAQSMVEPQPTADNPPPSAAVVIVEQRGAWYRQHQTLLADRTKDQHRYHPPDHHHLHHCHRDKYYQDRRQNAARGGPLVEPMAKEDRPHREPRAWSFGHTLRRPRQPITIQPMGQQPPPPPSLSETAPRATSFWDVILRSRNHGDCPVAPHIAGKQSVAERTTAPQETETRYSTPDTPRLRREKRPAGHQPATASAFDKLHAPRAASDIAPQRPNPHARVVGLRQLSRHFPQRSQETTAVCASQTAQIFGVLDSDPPAPGSSRSDVPSLAVNPLPSSFTGTTVQTDPTRSSAHTAPSSPTGAKLRSSGRDRCADFDLDDPKSFVSHPDLSFALDDTESLDIGVDDELPSFASLRNWRENNSRSFKPRTERPPRALASVGRQYCLSERELSDIIDAANTSVRSFDRQLYNPVSNDWKYVEGRDQTKSRWRLPTPTQKALMRSERVDALDSDDPMYPPEYPLLTSDNPADSFRRNSVSSSSSTDMYWRTTETIHVTASGPDAATDSILQVHNPAATAVSVSAQRPPIIAGPVAVSPNQGIPADLRFTGMDELDPTVDREGSYLSALLSNAENDLHALPMSATPPSGPQSSSLVTIESPSASTAATGGIGVEGHCYC